MEISEFDVHGTMHCEIFL